MNLSIIFLLLGFFSLPLVIAFDSDYSIWKHGLSLNGEAGLKLRADGAPLRNVYAVADIAIRQRVTSPKTGKTLLYGHSFLHVEGTHQDGAIRIEHVQPRPYQIGIRVLDYTVQNNDKQALPEKQTSSTIRKIYLVGQTTLTNAEFADPSSGKGLVLDVWSKNPVWTQGSNCCNQFVQNLVKKLKLVTPKQFDRYVALAKEYASLRLTPFTRTGLPLYIDTVTHWGANGGNEQIEFDTTDLKNPKLLRPASPVDDSGYQADTAVETGDGLKMPLAPPGSRVMPPSPFSDVALLDDSSSEAATGGDSSSGHSESSNDTPHSSIIANADKAQTVSSVRVGGVASDVTVILKDTAMAAGIAGVAIAPLFIILDFAKGDLVGGAFGAVGLLLGTLAVEGPVGWLVGGLAALFSILPSFFSKPSSELPSAHNATEILQYALFGDIRHTGNEKCREQNPNCTALYGPGVIAASLKWNNFDPIAFLLQYNAGYAMALPDIAANFYVIDSAKPDDGADKIATISCQPQKSGCTRFSCPGADRRFCGKATFGLNRSLITIPVLNQTADKIYDRIIPKPHGDCKLINDMSENHYSEYNITVTGSPAAIACGITASIDAAPSRNKSVSNAQNISTSSTQSLSTPSLQNLNFPSSPNTWNFSHPTISNSSSSSSSVSLINDPESYNGRPAAAHSLANMSTDGSIHEVAAPTPIGFPPNPLNPTNAVCLGGVGGNMCFPNGTYSIQTGLFGFDSSKVSSLSLPADASLGFTVPAKTRPHQALSLRTRRFTTNQLSSNRDFGTSFNDIAATAFGPRTFNVQVADGPPVVCLFSQPQYTGDVTCYGVGSGNLSTNAVNIPQSLTLHGNANVMIYGKYYGDDGGAKVTVDTADLTTIPLGVDDNFNKKIKAIWVIA